MEADEIARKVEYMELTLEADFQKEFIEAMQIPHMNDPFPHLKWSVKDEILNQCDKCYMPVSSHLNHKI